jgi:short-subunit dehydrogenase
MSSEQIFIIQEITDAINAYQVNVFGVMRITKLFAEKMAEKASGLIVVVGS